MCKDWTRMYVSNLPTAPKQNLNSIFVKNNIFILMQMGTTRSKKKYKQQYGKNCNATIEFAADRSLLMTSSHTVLMTSSHTVTRERRRAQVKRK